MHRSADQTSYLFSCLKLSLLIILVYILGIKLLVHQFCEYFLVLSYLFEIITASFNFKDRNFSTFDSHLKLK